MYLYMCICTCVFVLVYLYLCICISSIFSRVLTSAGLGDWMSRALDRVQSFDSWRLHKCNKSQTASSYCQVTHVCTLGVHPERRDIFECRWTDHSQLVLGHILEVHGGERGGATHTTLAQQTNKHCTMH